jgi:hypothetical protein
MLRTLNKIKPIIKQPPVKVFKCERYIEDCSKYCQCDDMIYKIAQKLNITIATFSMKQKDEIDEKKERCD